MEKSTATLLTPGRVEVKFQAQHLHWQVLRQDTLCDADLLDDHGKRSIDNA